MHGDHMRVAAQPRREPGLGAGTGDPGRPFLGRLDRIAEHYLLEGDLAGQPLVVSEPHMAHGAAAELVEQAVAAGDDPADSGLR
ncbi:hypothetical protein GCM10010448_09410 [Streptomyces glomeratus]|uniref:Uncharacterized protein n=1 Tax=Streptomyces glomeratus TaxID=284452 RepID=A0ABP6L5Q5_9ACTN